LPERAVGFGAPYAAIRAHGTLAVDLPQGPNFFLFSDPARACAALGAAGMLRVQSPDALARIREALRDVVSAYAAEGGYRLPMPALIASGAR
jgi:hypothetical protein